MHRFIASLSAIAVAGLCSTSAMAQSCDLDSSASPGLVDTGFNQAIAKDGNGGWYTSADPVTGKYPFMEAGTRSVGGSFRVKGLIGNYQGSSGTNYRDLDFVRFKVTQPCYVVATLSVGRDVGGFVIPFGAGERSELSVYTGNVETAATAKLVSDSNDTDGCPHVANYRFADGSTQSKVPVAAGDVLLIATTASNATGSTAYNGPLVYGLDVQLLPLDFASCGTATNDCITTSAGGGCSDTACCDAVCGLSPECCVVAWDSDCVQTGVSQCGNFLYTCEPGVSNDCALTPEVIDVTATPLTVTFDNTNANTDGPNDINTLCSALTAKDVWYQIGPMPADADVTISLCGLGNVGDSVITTYNLGAVSGLDVGQTLPSLFRGCRDDACDDNADGIIDAGGPSEYTMVNVVKDRSYLVRVGSYLEPGQDPASAPAIQGDISFNIRYTLWNSGRQRSVIRTADSTTTNLPLSTGYRSSSEPDYMLATPIKINNDCTVDGIEFCATTVVPSGASAIADRVKWVIFTRDDSSNAWMGAWSSTVVAEGELVFDSTKYANISSDAGKRYFLDLPAPVALTAGAYYVGLRGVKSGSSTGGLGFYVYGQDAIEQFNPANGRPCYWNCKNYAGAPGTWVVTTAASTPTYRVQTGDRTNVLYQVPVKLKGQVTPSAVCFGDIDLSGVVDNGDVAFALLDYGLCPGCGSDLDGSGEVDFGDIALILLSTGPCE